MTLILRGLRASTEPGAVQAALEDKLHTSVLDGAANDAVSIKPDTRMAAVFDQWVAEKRAEGQITPQSLTTYLGVLERDLRPAFGSLRLREVTPVAVNRVLMALSRAGKFDTARQVRKDGSVIVRRDRCSRTHALADVSLGQGGVHPRNSP